MTDFLLLVPFWCHLQKGCVHCTLRLPFYESKDVGAIVVAIVVAIVGAIVGVIATSVLQEQMQKR